MSALLFSVSNFICEIGTYSLRLKKWTKCCFMKQNCQIQMDVAQYENATRPLSILGIFTTRQHFQMR